MTSSRAAKTSLQLGFSPRGKTRTALEVFMKCAALGCFQVEIQLHHYDLNVIAPHHADQFNRVAGTRRNPGPRFHIADHIQAKVFRKVGADRSRFDWIVPASGDEIANDADVWVEGLGGAGTGGAADGDCGFLSRRDGSDCDRSF